MRRLLAILGIGLVMLGACGGGAANPEETVHAYINAYNAADVDGIVDLFAEDAVIRGHPGGSFSGSAQIRELHEEEADGTVTYAISNVVVDGNSVSWDHVWSGEDNGEPFEFCVNGHVADVEEGKITFWQWPVTNFEC